MPKGFTTKQIAPNVLEYRYDATGRCHYRVTFQRKGLKMARYIYPEANASDDIAKAKEKALRLAKRIAFDMADPLSTEEIAELFNLYEHAELELPEETETNNN